MCGIFVAISKSNNKLDRGKCRSILKKMTHRGPDRFFDSLLYDGRLYMGQTILSITGRPDEALNHYRVSRSGLRNIVINGEIYNYASLARRYLNGFDLRTGTDTEVLVNLHDILTAQEITPLLNGMYAYSVFDSETGKLYVARDLVGEKVLYTYEDDKVVIFASETTSIIEYLGYCEVNKSLIQDYFFTRHLLTHETTLFGGIHVMPPGKVIEINLNSYSQTVIYDCSLKNLISETKLEIYDNCSEEELLEELEGVCRASAKLLKPAIGCASIFSGGIDSSLASWFMDQQSGQSPWFVTLQFGDKDFVSNSVSRFVPFLSGPIHTLDVSEQRFTHNMDRFYSKYKTMMATHSFVSQMILSEYVSDNGYKVLIGGDGADELFGGYEYYKNFTSIKQIPEENPSPYSGFVSSSLELNKHEKKDFRELKKIEWENALALFSHVDDVQDRVLQAVLYLDSLIEMETVGLRSSDLMSMANSVESRGFFVTRDMLEFAVNIPAKYKIDLTSSDPLMVTKPLLKKLFTKIFNASLLFEKQGFSGYPNEGGRALVKNDYRLVQEFLSISSRQLDSIVTENATEWKALNTELFLRSVS